MDNTTSNTIALNESEIVDDCLRLLVDVLHGELDGHPCTTTERMRAAVFLYRWYLGGNLAVGDPADEMDPLSAAIEEWQEHRKKSRENEEAFRRQFFADPPSVVVSEDRPDCLPDAPCMMGERG